MRRRLDWYLMREMFVPFLIGTFTVVLMFQINTYMALGKQLSLENIPFLAVVQYILLLTPQFMVMTLPVGMSLAAALGIARIARESELTAMRAAGVPVRRVLLPVAFFGLLCAIGNFAVLEYLAPRATRQATRLGATVGLLGLSPVFARNRSIDFGRFTASLGEVQRMPDESLILRDILLIERFGAGETTLITAETGRYLNGVWTFDRGLVRRFKGDDLVQAKVEGSFTINEKIVVPDLFTPPQGQELTIPELVASIRQGERLGSDVKLLLKDLHNKFAIPAACLLFSIISPVFVIFFARSGGFVGVFVSFIVVLLYYNVWVVSSQILVKLPAMPAWAAAWLPIALFGALGLLAMRRLE